MKSAIAYALAAVMTASAAPFHQTPGLNGQTNALDARSNSLSAKIHVVDQICRNPQSKNLPYCRDLKPQGQNRKANKTKGTLIKREDTLEARRDPTVDDYRTIICRDPNIKSSPLCKPKPNKAKWGILKRNDTLKAHAEPKASIEMMWPDADGNPKHKRDMASAERAPFNKVKKCLRDRSYQKRHAAFCIKAVCGLKSKGKSKLCRAMKKGAKRSVDFRLAARQDDEASEAGMDAEAGEPEDEEEAIEKRDEVPSDTESSFGQGRGQGQGQG